MFKQVGTVCMYVCLCMSSDFIFAHSGCMTQVTLGFRNSMTCVDILISIATLAGQHPTCWYTPCHSFTQPIIYTYVHSQSHSSLIQSGVYIVFLGQEAAYDCHMSKVR